MKNLAKIMLALLLLSLVSCVGSYTNETELKSQSPDGKTTVTVIKKSRSIFPSNTEKIENSANAYNTAVKANVYALRSRDNQGQAGSVGSGYLPEDGSVLFSTKDGQESIGPVLVNDSEKYRVKILNGPYKSDLFLNPGDAIEAVKPVKPGDELIFSFEWTEILPDDSNKTPKTGQNTVVRRIKAGQPEVLISDSNAKKIGQI